MAKAYSLLVGPRLFAVKLVEALDSNRLAVADPYAPALTAAQRVFAAKKVEHGPTDAPFGERLELDSMRRIESVNGLDQTDGTGGDQVVYGNAPRDAAFEMASLARARWILAEP